MNDTEYRRKIWGRRQARPLKTYHKDLMTTLLPQIRLTLEAGKKIENVPPETWLEIGFGGGEHLAAQAASHPNAHFIGCEPFINGVASLLNHVSENNLQNCQIAIDDARLLLEALPDQSLSCICVLFPDPWPKKRHHKRRIVNDQTVAAFARVLKPGGQLRLATDIEEYAIWMQRAVATCPAFQLNLGERTSIHERPTPQEWPITRYEQKGMKAGRQSAYMVYTRDS